MTSAVSPQLARDWSRIQSALRCSVADSDFDIWLEPLSVRELAGGTLLLTAPEQIRAWVGQRFGAVLQRSAEAVLGPGVAVELASPGAPRRPAHARPPAAGHAGDAERLNPKFTFDQFVIGDSNQFAHAAALAVAELPGHAYNPLFLYGPPGVGKTHLLHSIARYARTFGDGLTVRYSTIEHFTNEFVRAVHGGDMGEFKARFRHVDILLIDDVQFLERKAKTKEEFFHTFNALYEMGSQLVLTCDRLPRDIDEVEDRLRERFACGLVAEIRAPDFPTRLAILRKRVHHDGVALADDSALHVIARRITANARALESALIHVVARHSLTRRPIDARLTDEVLAELCPASGADPAPALTVDRVQEVACEVFGVTREELLSSTRVARVAWPRQVAMYLSRRHTDASLPAIGARFGGRSHTTVLHACRRIQERVAADPGDAIAVHELERRLVCQS